VAKVIVCRVPEMLWSAPESACLLGRRGHPGVLGALTTICTFGIEARARQREQMSG
jgi:fluoride ion exporter CrcB/FEX